MAHARLLAADYDTLDRLAVSRQRREGEPAWTATVFGYDRDGNLARRADDEVGALMGVHRRADDAAVAQVANRCDVQRSLPGSSTKAPIVGCGSRILLTG